MRLIDADALCIQIEDHLVSLFTCDSIDWYKGQAEMKKYVLEQIKTAPTIEAEPVRRGEWVECGHPYDIDGTYYCYCSVCGGSAHEHHDYCPNCGARMVNDDD